MSLLRKLAVAATAVVVAIPVAGVTAAQAGTTHQVSSATQVAAAKRHTGFIVLTGGRTRLRLDAGTASVLTDNGVTVAPASEAKVRHGGITFPIKGGLINAATLGGSINHVGGLTFSAGGRSLTIRDFQVSAHRKTLTAWVDQVGARIPVLRLNLAHATVASTQHRLTVGNVKTTLRKGAADALNSYFSTNLFTKGLPIGTVRVSASAKVLKG